MSSLRLTIGALFISALVFGLGNPHVAWAQEPSLIIEGQITNGTAGGGGVGGVTVVLHQESAAAHDDLETITDADGRFRFDGIVDPTKVYGVSVRYQGALYGRDLDLSAGSPPPVLLTVYDAMDDDDVLSASSASVLFAGVDKSAQTVSALEIVKIVNISDRTYVPGPEPMRLLRFGLPPGARGLRVDSFLPGADFVQVDRGFALLGSVPPGEHEVMYTYEFPYSGSAATITKSLNYGAEHLRVLAPEGAMKLSSDDLGATSSVTIGERSYQLLEATGLAPGERITLELEGLPHPSLGERVSQSIEGARFEYAAPVALGLLMAGLIGYALWRRASERRRAAELSGAGTGNRERQSLDA